MDIDKAYMYKDKGHFPYQTANAAVHEFHKVGVA